ncbi:hypothetical protein ABT317_36530 [Streptomyces carpinensis]|uniref:Uncharacterized protein n=1 Tax=Streptomyces carpinensis TaxID=66369 RepID=A0ABV1WDS7_9ACTN
MRHHDTGTTAVDIPVSPPPNALAALLRGAEAGRRPKAPSTEPRSGPRHHPTHRPQRPVHH